METLIKYVKVNERFTHPDYPGIVFKRIHHPGKPHNAEVVEGTKDISLGVRITVSWDALVDTL